MDLRQEDRQVILKGQLVFVPWIWLILRPDALKKCKVNLRAKFKYLNLNDPFCFKEGRYKIVDNEIIEVNNLFKFLFFFFFSFFYFIYIFCYLFQYYELSDSESEEED